MDIPLCTQCPGRNTCSLRHFHMRWNQNTLRKPLQKICGNSRQVFNQHIVSSNKLDESCRKVQVDLETGKRRKHIDFNGQGNPTDKISTNKGVQNNVKYKEQFKTKEDATKEIVEICLKPVGTVSLRNRVKEVESNDYLKPEEVKKALDAPQEEFLKLIIKKSLTEILTEVTSKGIDEISHEVMTMDDLSSKNDIDQVKELKSCFEIEKKLFDKVDIVKDIIVLSDEDDYQGFPNERKSDSNQDKIDKVIQSLMEEVNLRMKARERHLKRRLQKKLKKEERSQSRQSRQQSEKTESPPCKEKILLPKKMLPSPIREIKIVPALERFVSPLSEQGNYSQTFESQCSEMLRQERNRSTLEKMGNQTEYQYKSVNEKESESWYSKTEQDGKCLWAQNHKQLQATVGSLGWSSTQINYINRLEKRP